MQKTIFLTCSILKITRGGNLYPQPPSPQQFNVHKKAQPESSKSDIFWNTKIRLCDKNKRYMQFSVIFL